MNCYFGNYKLVDTGNALCGNAVLENVPAIVTFFRVILFTGFGLEPGFAYDTVIIKYFTCFKVAIKLAQQLVKYRS